MLWKLLIIIGLVRVLALTHKPFLCSGIYTAMVSIFIVLSNNPFYHSVILIGIAFALSSLYFWLLDWLEGKGALYWVVFILGFIIPLM